MKRTIIATAFVLIAALPALAQQSIEEVLSRVEANNKELRAQEELTDALKLEARTGNSLSNPTVETENMWGGPENGRNSELTVSQAFEFPTVYANRNKLARLKAAQYDSEKMILRQNILLQAKQLCIEIIYLRRQRNLLQERLSNAQRLWEAYGKKLETGDASLIETNKIQLELIDVQTRHSLNDAALSNALEQLYNLAGGEELPFQTSEFPEIREPGDYAALESAYLEWNPELQSVRNELEVNRRAVTLSKNMSLPQFEVGYRHDFGMEGRFKGFLVGMSLPIFENRNKVKTAKAVAAATDSRLQSVRQNSRSELKQLYDQAQILFRSIVSLQTVLEVQNTLPVLNKALEAGQISVIEYFTEIETLYQSEETLLQSQRDYLQTSAQIYRFEL